MMHVCETLKQVLTRIRVLLESGEYESLPEYLSERMVLIERLHECRPDKTKLDETIELLKSIIREERFLMKLAEEKKDNLQKEMKIFQTRRVAAAKYQNQSHGLLGVQP